MKHKYAEFIRLMANGVRIEASKDSVYWSTAFYWQFDDNSNVWQFRISTNQLPDAQGWIQWLGGENPAPGKRVDIFSRGGNDSNWLADNLDWRHTKGSGDIIRYRIVKQKKWRWMYCHNRSTGTDGIYLTAHFTEEDVAKWVKRFPEMVLGPRQDWTEVCDE